MFLTPQQINDLLTIIHTNQAIFITKELGIEFLSEYDKSLLVDSGVDWETLYSLDSDSFYQSFHFGMLAESLNNLKSLNKLSYQQLKDYIKQGNYIPVTNKEKSIVNSIKSQTLSDIKTHNGRIFQDLNNILHNQTQEQFIREELEEGFLNRKSLREISNTLHHKSKDWQRDFDRIVEYQMNTAYQEGKVAWLEKANEGEEVEVYKRVFHSACKHCLSLYTTSGYLSEPRIFKTSDLRLNGTNIGRKTSEWKPVIGSTHPFCRCLIFQYPKGFLWNKETQFFDIPIKQEKREILKKPREKIRIKVGGQEFKV